MTGQDAVNTAREFNQRLDFTGVVLTKLDGDTRGGAALSIRTVVDKPVKFVGTGEKPEDLATFHPARMADRILGMGDVVSLVEKIQQTYDEKKQAELEAKMRRNKFDYNDFLEQMRKIRSMGSIRDLASMIPGMDSALKDVEISDDAFKPIEAIIQSMTAYERANPDVVTGSRRQRIAKGSGTSLQEVNRLVKQFDQMRKMMKAATSNPMKMMRQMKQMRGQMRR